MKSLPIVLFIFFVLQSCDKKIDVKGAKELVSLSKTDLKYFSAFRRELLLDSLAIRKQSDTYTPDKRIKWDTTNSFYLNQIDSVKYTALFSKLKGKLVDNIFIDKKGNTIFRIKENTQLNTGEYNESYLHGLINNDCNCPLDSIFNDIDSIFVDSVINKEWRYVSYKVLTGH